MWNCLEKVVAVAGGCIVASTGATDPGTMVGGVVGAAGLFAFWRDGKGARGPESEARLGKIRRALLEDMERDPEWTSFSPELREAADYHLGRVLLDCRLDRDRLARSAVTGEGFPKAATVIWLDALAEVEPLFAIDLPEANPDARRFAGLVIGRALELTWADRDFFASFEPDLMKWMAQGIGETREEVKRIGGEVDHLRATGDEMAADLKKLLAQFGESELGARATREIGSNRPFVILARRINQEVDDPGQALAELTEMVELMLRQKAEAERGTNSDDWVDAALRRIAEKSARGEFDAAAKEAEGAFADWEKREAERRETEKQAGLRLIQANIDQNILLRDAEMVALWVQRGIIQENDVTTVATDPLIDAAKEWQTRGNRKGHKLDLEVAVALAQRALAASVSSDERVRALEELAGALLPLGDSEVGTDRLEQAVTAYRTGLRETARERAPLDWARMQTKLGNALSQLAVRQTETGQLATVGDVQVALKEAISAHRAALEERTRDRSPLGWATTQNNLGDTLLALSHWEYHQRTTLLEAAISAFQEALQERRRELVPLDWAATKNNLGYAFLLLGSPDGRKDLLGAAVAAFRASEEEWARDQLPLAWAAMQSNLGVALENLGMLETGTVQLKEATAAYRAALEEYTRDRLPLQWAKTSLHLSQLLGRITERTHETRVLDEAVSTTKDVQAFAVESGHALLEVWAAHILSDLNRLIDLFKIRE